jgi:hypothetical protein
MGSLRSQIWKTKRVADDRAGTLVLPDGTEVRCAEGDRLDALLAAIAGDDHRLLPVLRAMDPSEEELANLVRAIEGGEDEG